MPIHFCKYQAFQAGVRMVQFTVMLSGYSRALRAFIKVIKEVVMVLADQGVDITM